MILFINKQIEAEFNNPELDPVVRMIVLATAAYIHQKYGEPIYITSVYRPDDKKSAHGWWRAVDLDNNAGLTDTELQDVCDWVNEIFSYDLMRSDKKVCLYHEVAGRGSIHLHLQVHQNTTLRRS